MANWRFSTMTMDIYVDHKPKHQSTIGLPGLCRATKRHNLTRGARFESYDYENAPRSRWNLSCFGAPNRRFHLSSDVQCPEVSQAKLMEESSISAFVESSKSLGHSLWCLSRRFSTWTASRSWPGGMQCLWRHDTSYDLI